jgi:hypothetical protein
MRADNPDDREKHENRWWARARGSLRSDLQKVCRPLRRFWAVLGCIDHLGMAQDGLGRTVAWQKGPTFHMSLARGAW